MKVPASLDDVSGAGRIVYDATNVFYVDCTQDQQPGRSPCGLVYLFPLKTRFVGIGSRGDVLAFRWWPSWGEVCDLEGTEREVDDFNPDEGGSVRVRYSKSGKPRLVWLTDEGRALFEAFTAGRQGKNFIFPRPDGKPWGRDMQQRRLRKACERAGINPPTNFHALRHTYASLLVMAGVPLVVVAKNLGHADTRMCERHYMHLAPSYVAETIRSKAPKLGIVKPSKVARLGTARA